VDLNYIHRRSDAQDSYFVANHDYKSVDTVCSFRISNRIPELWCPETGKIEPDALYRIVGQRIEVPIHFDPAGSVFVVFRYPATHATHLVDLSVDSTTPWPQSQPVVHHAQVLSALYGVMTDVDVTDAIRNWLKSGEPSLTATVALDGGADPAPNIVKRLKIDYTVNGNPESTTVGEFYPVALPDASAGTPNVVIVKAMFGVPGPLADVTSEANTLVQGGDSSIRASNDLNNGVDPAPNVRKNLKITYSVDGVTHSRTVLEGTTLTFFDTSETVEPAAAEAAFDTKGRPALLVWRNGTYTASLSTGSSPIHITEASVPPERELDGPWKLAFPSGWGAPPSYQLDKLSSWTLSADTGVKYFSGTATYSKGFDVSADELGPGKSLFLDLGAVNNLADVTVNGHELGVLWKAPFRVDITGVVRHGDNSLSIKVTNLWPNRLIGDSFLPIEKRFTWTTFNPYNQSSDLLDSGILGPVKLESAILLPLSKEGAMR
jgi:hypothetical protein